MAERAKVGKVEILAFVDVAPPPFKPNQFYPDVPLSAWEPYKKEHLDENGNFRTNFGFFALRCPSGIVLVDTGLGPGPHGWINGARGQLMERLQGAGIRPEDVKGVVITHFHSDHTGWTLTYQGERPRATFPRARYYLPKGDWDYFTRPDILSQSPEEVKTKVLPLKELGVMELVGDGYSITPELTVLATPGHTPGHISVLISSQGEKGMVVGDVFHGTIQVTEPGWCAGFDMDKPLARQTRLAILDRLEKEGMTVAAGHLPLGRNIGKVVTLQGRRYWKAL